MENPMVHISGRVLWETCNKRQKVFAEFKQDVEAQRETMHYTALTRDINSTFTKISTLHMDAKGKLQNGTYLL